MFEKSFEGNREQSKEKETIVPSIRLEFFRHDEREPMAEGQTDDHPVTLSQKGRKHAVEIGKTKNPQSEVGVAYDSPRVRSKETALRQLLTNEEEITSADSYDDIKRKINQYFKARKFTARKDYTDERLNFEGFTVILLPSQEGKESMIEMRYKDKHWEITPELIEAIIEDKRKLTNP